MKIIGHMVTRNELRRYVMQTLPALKAVCDEVVVFDDLSDDGTLQYVRELGVYAFVRSDDTPPFSEHEGRFRGGAWDMLNTLLAPTPEDWVLCLDADEVLTGNRADLEHLAGGDHDTYAFHVDEVFGWQGRTPLVRIDGYWGQITAVRFARWRSAAQFYDRREGCGSLPQGWEAEATTVKAPRIMHFGYAQAADRLERYSRYRAGRGHNPAHIDSILRPGVLVPWEDELPEGFTP